MIFGSIFVLKNIESFVIVFYIEIPLNAFNYFE